MRFKRTATILLVLLPLLSACTPGEMALWRAWYAASSSDCHGQVDEQWPSSSRAWAHRIVERESRGIATAQNRYSTAAGCFQLLRMHAFRFDRHGYSWSDRYNARANVTAALDLYHEAGTRPWA
jgi:hypothetical protein